jgi:hypothetical protein
MTLKYIRIVFSIIFMLAILPMVGCDTSNATHAFPEEGPEVVLERFYGYISEAKIKGGASPAREAFKLIDAKNSQLIEGQFLEVIKKYPAGFIVEVGEAEITGSHAIVAINYKLASSFGGHYTVSEVNALNLDNDTNTWKIDFTGETHGDDRDTLMASEQESDQQGS